MGDPGGAARGYISERYILPRHAGTPIHALRDPRAPSHGADVGIRDPEAAGVRREIFLERELRSDLSRAPRTPGERLGAKTNGARGGPARPPHLRDHRQGTASARSVAPRAAALRAASKRAPPEALPRGPRVPGCAGGLRGSRAFKITCREGSTAIRTSDFGSSPSSTSSASRRRRWRGVTRPSRRSPCCSRLRRGVAPPPTAGNLFE